MLRKSPGFTVVAVLTLALGIGVNSAVFSIINGALLRPLPYPDPQQLIVVWDQGIGQSNLAKIFDTFHDFEAWEKHSRSFEQIAAETWATKSQILSGRGPAREIKTIPVSVGFFSMLGARAERGRTFIFEDMKRGCSVVLADRFWRESLGSEHDIIGKSIALDQRPCTVVGVLAPGFTFYPDGMQVWTLITPEFVVPADKLLVAVFGRLKHGVTREQAQAELTAIHTALHQADGLERTVTPIVYNLQSEFTWLAGRSLRTTLWVLLGAVGLVLLIACLNVANLLLGRSFAREREMAVRAALGSGRGRVIRQLLTEGLLLASIGGAFGLLVAFGAIRGFRAARPIELPVGADIGLDMKVLAFTMVLSILTALVFGLVPAWKATRVDINEVLKAGGRGAASSGAKQWIAKVLLASEMALSVVLLVGAGLLMQSVLRMGSTPLGFEPARVITTTLSLPSNGYADPKQRLTFYDQLIRRLDALPGVSGAALTSSLPPQGGGFTAIEVQGREPVTAATEILDVQQRQIGPGYFRVLKMPLRSGRDFDAHDRLDSEPVAIINDALAKLYFPKGDAVGQRIRTFDPRPSEPRPSGSGRLKNPWVTIVGIAGSEKQAIVYQEMNWIESAFLFRPVAQDPPASLSVALRTSSDQSTIGIEMQRAIASMDGNIPVNAIEPLEHRISQLFTYPRFRAVLFSVFAIFTLLLAAIGLHGVLQQFVAQRTREIGVRIAVGARIGDILRLVVRQGGQPLLAGLVIGLLASAALTRYIASLLYGVGQTDPTTFGAVMLVLMATAAVAIALPARRAARVDPMVALRYE
jgi:putative ABC transport system permease protein